VSRLLHGGTAAPQPAACDVDPGAVSLLVPATAARPCADRPFRPHRPSPLAPGKLWTLGFTAGLDDKNDGDETVLALTTGRPGEAGGRVWRSGRGGGADTWADVTPKMPGALDGGDKGPRGVYQLMLVDEARPTPDPRVRGAEDGGAERVGLGRSGPGDYPADVRLVVARGIDDRYWLSGDGGDEWTERFLPTGFVHYGGSLHPHPHRAGALAALLHREDCAFAGGGEADCPHTLLVTTSFGTPLTPGVDPASDEGRREEDARWRDLGAEAGPAAVSWLQVEWGVRANDDALPGEPGHRSTEELRNDLRLMATALVRGTGAAGPLTPDDVRFVVGGPVGRVPDGAAADPPDWFRFDADGNPTGATSLVLPCASMFAIQGDAVLVAVPAMCAAEDAAALKKRHAGSGRNVPARATANVALFISHDEGKSFEEACVPAREMDSMFTVTDLRDGRGRSVGSLMVSDHDEEDAGTAGSPIGQGYVTGGGGLPPPGSPDWAKWGEAERAADATARSVFGPSLRGIFWETPVFGWRVTPDVAPIDGFPGVLLANSALGSAGGGGGAGPDGPQTPDDDPARFDSRVVTRRSSNNGASWSRILLPLDPDTGKPSLNHPQCDLCPPLPPSDPDATPDPAHRHDRCSLHLHFDAGWYFAGHAPVYSRAAAPGLILATGHYGNHLERGADAQCVWLSRDAGATWRDVAVGGHVYEIGNSGGVLALAKHATSGLARSVKLSVDDGNSWVSVPFDEPIAVSNVRQEPGGRADSFLVYGESCSDDGSPARSGCRGRPGQDASAPMIYAVDASTLFKGGFDDCPDAGWEDWSPSAAAGNAEGCALGARFTARRRRSGACCRVPFAWLARGADGGVGEPCGCGEEDLACDFGARAPAPGGRRPSLAAAPAWSGLGLRPLGSPLCESDGTVDASWCPAMGAGAYLASATLERLAPGDGCDPDTLPDAGLPDTDGRGAKRGHGKHGGGGGGGAGAFARGLGRLAAALAVGALVVGGAISGAAAVAARGGAAAAAGEAAAAARRAAAAVGDAARAAGRGLAGAALGVGDGGERSAGLDPLGPDADHGGFDGAAGDWERAPLADAPPVATPVAAPAAAPAATSSTPAATPGAAGEENDERAALLAGETPPSTPLGDEV